MKKDIEKRMTELHVLEQRLDVLSSYEDNP